MALIKAVALLRTDLVRLPDGLRTSWLSVCDDSTTKGARLATSVSGELIRQDFLLE